MKTILILSPHLDDAALSCGGWMAAAAAAGGQVTVFNLFCAPYKGPLSPAARELHASWGDPVDISGLRLAEDRQALGMLGAQGMYGDARDLIYRQDAQGAWLYAHMADLQGRRHPADDALVRHYFEIITRQFNKDAVEVYAPLGIGGHIDHLLAFDIGAGLQQAGYAVWFYEDLPYALREDWLEARMKSITGMAASVKLFSLENLETKIAALHAYASQIAALFQNEANMREWMSAQALRMSGREDMGGEKVWAFRKM